MMGNTSSMSHSETMNHEQEMRHESDYDNEDLISTDIAEDAIDRFLSDNLHGVEVGEIWFVEGNMISPPIYEADIILADGSEGIMMIDALTGEPAGILVGRYVDIMRNAGRQDMGDHDSMHGDSTGSSGSQDQGDHSAHNH